MGPHLRLNRRQDPAIFFPDSSRLPNLKSPNDTRVTRSRSLDLDPNLVHDPPSTTISCVIITTALLPHATHSGASSTLFPVIFFLFSFPRAWTCFAATSILVGCVHVFLFEQTLLRNFTFQLRPPLQLQPHPRCLKPQKPPCREPEITPPCLAPRSRRCPPTSCVLLTTFLMLALLVNR